MSSFRSTPDAVRTHRVRNRTLLLALLTASACGGGTHDIGDLLSRHGNPEGGSDAGVAPSRDGGGPTDPCAATSCLTGTHCEVITVMCIRAPCPPIASCVPNGSGGSTGTGGGGTGTGGGGGGGGSGGTGGATVPECGPSRPCPQPPCACIDTNMDGKCDNVCPTFQCIGGMCVAISTPPPPTGLKQGDSCGGFRVAGAGDCDTGLFCQNQAGSLCGAADAPGICVKVPTSCPRLASQPVCGCDGKTYASACLATVAKVSILDLGACK